MSDQSFRELGVSAACRRSARGSVDRPPLPDPGANAAGRAPGRRRARPLAHGIGQDARLRAADRRAHEPRRRTPVRARARADARARLAGDRGLPAARQGARADRRAGLRRRAAQVPGQPDQGRGHPRRDARPARGPGQPPAREPLAGAHIRARRGRPHARHGLQAAGRQARAAPAAEPADDVLLGDARRRGRRARPQVHERRDAHRGRALGAAPAGRDRAPLHLGHGRLEGRDADRAHSRRRLDARLRPHQARRRPARAEAEEARRRCGRDARRHVAERARAGARPLRERQGRHARRHRRGRARARPRRRHARDQLRSARRGQGLRPPHGPHRPRRPHAARRSPSSCPSSRPTRAASRGASATRSSSKTPACDRRPRSSSTRAGADADRSGNGLPA